MPLDSQLAGGVVHRNDTDGGIDYVFVCSEGFVMTGSNHVTCKDGVYNGSAPDCLPKCKEAHISFVFVFYCRFINVRKKDTSPSGSYFLHTHALNNLVVRVSCDLFPA